MTAGEDGGPKMNHSDWRHTQTNILPHFLAPLMDRAQNYAFILHLFALHFICITFAFHLHFA